MKKWLIIGALAWSLCGVLNIYFKNWTELEALGTWILAGGVFFAILQIIEARRSNKAQLEQMERSTSAQLMEVRCSTNAQIAVGLFEKFRSDEMLKILRNTIYNNDRETLRSFATGRKITEVEKIGHVLDWLDILGILVRKDIVDRDLAIMGFAGATAVRCWYKLVDFTRKMQSKRGFYNENYEDFVHHCIEIFKEDKIEVYMKGIDGDLVELIQKLPEDQHPRSLEEIKKQREAKKRQKKKA